MKELLTPTVLYTAFAVSALAELYFFMMQRSSLEISRAADIHPRDGRYMLPLWYILVWPVRLTKWGAALAIAFFIHWGIALVLLVIAFFVSIFIPIPHHHFIGLFHRKVHHELTLGENIELYQMLEDLLDRAEAAIESQ